MKDSFKIALGIFLAVIGLGLCGACAFFLFSAGGLALIAAVPTPTAAPPIAPIPPKTSETPLPSQTTQPPGGFIIHENMKLTLVEYEFSLGYQGLFDYTDEPPDGAKYLLVHLVAENISKNASFAPSESAFAVIHLGVQIDSDFASYPQGYADYEGGEVFPGVSKEGWIRFTVPVGAPPADLTVTYKPFDLFGDTYYSWNLAP